MDGEYLKVEVKCQIYYADFFVEIFGSLIDTTPFAAYFMAISLHLLAR